MKTKEIIGYKLKDEKYREAALKITGMSEFFDTCKTEVYCFGDRSHASGKVKEFGVLDLWFEPVYKEEPELEGWVKVKGFPEYLVFLEKGHIKYGFNTLGKWFKKEYNEKLAMQMAAIPATDAEVEKALIQEATKRGFKKGVKAKCFFDGEIEQVDNIRFKYYRSGASSKGLWINEDCKIFENGKWAEIIKEETHEVIFPKHLEGKLKITFR